MAEPTAPSESKRPSVPLVAEPQWLCASDRLAEKGVAVLFDVRQYRTPARAFALRFEGRVVAYLNRCAHVPTEMDWQPGEFLDREREFIICSIHGATYEPLSGHCVAGPACPRGRLSAIRVEERDGQVYWYPSRDTQPAIAGAPTVGTGSPGPRQCHPVRRDPRTPAVDPDGRRGDEFDGAAPRDATHNRTP